MTKKLLMLAGAGLLFLGKPELPVFATDVSVPETTSSSEIVTSSSSEEESTEIVSSEPNEIENVIDEQIALIESIIVAIFASFAGTGTVALIVKVALSKLTKQMTKKVTDAEAQNKISTEQAQQTIKTILDFEQILKNQVDALEATVKELIQNQNFTNENIKMMLDEYKQRDEEIKDLIVKELGDDLE